MSAISEALRLIGRRRLTRVYDRPVEDTLATYIVEYSNPVGTLISKFTSTSPGAGWLLVSGQPLLKADYADLYAEIGGMFGEDATSFNLPDLTNKYLTGVGDTAAGASVGQNSIVLSAGQMPVHNHTFTPTAHSHGITDPGHTHTAGEIGTSILDQNPNNQPVIVSGNTGSATTGISVDSASADGTIGNAGLNESVDIRPNSIAVYYFIKTGV